MRSFYLCFFQLRIKVELTKYNFINLMKFKYHFLEKKLWRIEDNHLYEVSEENRHIGYYLCGFRISFKLGENEWWLFNRSPKRLIVNYNHGTGHYEKELTRDLSQIETIFEFTESRYKITKQNKGVLLVLTFCLAKVKQQGVNSPSPPPI